MSKYHNKRYGGFDSKKEKARYEELLLMQRAGMIQGLTRQVRFELIPAQYQNGRCILRKTVYVADFTYWQNGKFVVEDVKGYKEGNAYSLYMIKKKLLFQRYGYLIKET